jgi:DNA-binding XRE family transcriptional regulator
MQNFMMKIQRSKIGLNENQAAHLAHMTKKEYTDIEDNLAEPKLKEMVSISKVLGMSIEELFNWENRSVCISVCKVVQEGGFEPPQALTL